jgi:hypothetical protein
MGKNTKPILSVLVEEEKKEKFAELARRNKYSMGWLLNDCIDRMLEADSIDIYRASVSTEDTNRPSIPTPSSGGFSPESIDEMVRLAVERHVSDISGFLPIETVEQMAIGAMDNHLDRLVKESLGSLDIQKIVNESIEVAIEPIEMKVAKIEQSLLDSPRRVEMATAVDEVVPTPAPELPSDRVDEVGEGLTIAELAAKIGKTRQAIEGYRDKERLTELGYRAERVGRNWLYWAVDEEH